MSVRGQIQLDTFYLIYNFLDQRLDSMMMNRLIKTFLMTLMMAMATQGEVEKGASPVAFFGEHPVHAEEFQLHLRNHVALVAVHFKTQHDRDLSGSEWLEEYGGEVPIELLQTRALKSCQKAVALQVLRESRQIGERLPFPDFAEACRKVNQERVRDRAEGKILYGPVQYSPSQLYAYKLGNIRIQLKDALSSGTFEEKDQALEEALQELIGKWEVRLESEKLQALAAQKVGAQ